MLFLIIVPATASALCLKHGVPKPGQNHAGLVMQDRADEHGAAEESDTHSCIYKESPLPYQHLS